MASRRQFLAFSVAAMTAGAASAGLTGCQRTGNPDLPTRRVLFVGNSYTDFNGGLDQFLAGLAPNTTVARVAPGGMTLHQHATNPATLALLSPEHAWELVVLQEQSQLPVRDPRAYAAGAAALAGRIRAAGVLAALLQTWARPDSAGVTAAALAEATNRVAGSIGATVVPAGNAFAASLSAAPTIQLNQADGHPTVAGSYLAACVCYSVIFSTSPVGNSYGAGLPEDAVAHLQRVAATATGRRAG